VALLVVYLHAISIELALVFGVFIIVADLVMVIVYLIGLPRYQHKRARYAHLSDTGKLLLGHVMDKEIEVDATKTVAYSYTLSYSFQTPEGKVITGKHNLTKNRGNN
jgi:hypothetical protein